MLFKYMWKRLGGPPVQAVNGCAARGRVRTGCMSRQNRCAREQAEDACFGVHHDTEPGGMRNSSVLTKYLLDGERGRLLLLLRDILGKNPVCSLCVAYSRLR